MLSEQQRQQFRTEGYLLVPDALANIGPQRVRDTYEQVRAQTEAQWRETVAADTGKGVYGLGAAAHVMHDLYQYDPLFLDLSNNPAVIPILEAVVGLDLQLTEMIAHNHPADTDAHIEWHRDWPPWNHPTQILKAKVFY